MNDRWYDHPDYPFGGVNSRTGTYYSHVLTDSGGEMRLLQAAGSFYSPMPKRGTVIPTKRRYAMGQRLKPDEVAMTDDTPAGGMRERIEKIVACTRLFDTDTGMTVQLRENIAALVAEARREELYKVHSFLASERLRRDKIESDTRKRYGGGWGKMTIHLETANEEFSIISDFISKEIDRLFSPGGGE